MPPRSESAPPNMPAAAFTKPAPPPCAANRKVYNTLELRQHILSYVDIPSLAVFMRVETGCMADVARELYRTMALERISSMEGQTVSPANTSHSPFRAQSNRTWRKQTKKELTIRIDTRYTLRRSMRSMLASTGSTGSTKRSPMSSNGSSARSGANYGHTNPSLSTVSSRNCGRNALTCVP
jgi:hypothetical protein